MMAPIVTVNRTYYVSQTTPLTKIVRVNEFRENRPRKNNSNHSHFQSLKPKTCVKPIKLGAFLLSHPQGSSVKIVEPTYPHEKPM